MNITASTLCFPLLFCLSVATQQQSQQSGHEESYQLGVTLMIVLMVARLYGGQPHQRKNGTRGETIKRVRRSVSSIMYELGGYSRRFFRMHDSSFWLLHSLLREKINKATTQSRHRSRKKRKITAPNGIIHSSTRLSIALRYFAGGDPLDISLVHGVSHSEVLKSVWIVIDAVHETVELDINFPTIHAEQRQIALEFKNKSKAEFDCCVGYSVDARLTVGRKIFLMHSRRNNHIICYVTLNGPSSFY